MTMRDNGGDENRISVKEDEEVEVVEMDGDDWWMVLKDGVEGYVPASFLELT